ncbi:hypothetical protein GCM10007862_13760 [Dyella lipolytica]|nr:hypothetical protein GCM10007862_13760 [Dyella lipolytica]
MRLLVSVGKAFAGALVGVLAAMYMFGFFVPHGVQLWPAFGIASGIALATGIRSQWSLSTTVGAVLVGVLAATGDVVGIWLSARP